MGNHPIASDACADFEGIPSYGSHLDLNLLNKSREYDPNKDEIDGPDFLKSRFLYT